MVLNLCNTIIYLSNYVIIVDSISGILKLLSEQNGISCVICCIKKAVLKKFVKFRGKHLHRSLYLIRDSDTSFFLRILPN